MNERIRELAEQAKGFVDLNQHIGGTNGCMVYTYDGLEKFAELIIDAIYDRVEQEIIDESEINKTQDNDQRCYLNGNNGGITDALYIIDNFLEL